MEEHEVYETIGADGFQRLCAAFYQQVPTDDILGPMYPENDLEGAEQRLLAFLVYRFGGPQDYILERGHPRMRMRHAPFPITMEARNRWMTLMNNALLDSKLDQQAASILRSFFEQMSRFLINRN